MYSPRAAHGSGALRSTRMCLRATRGAYATVSRRWPHTLPLQHDLNMHVVFPASPAAKREFQGRWVLVPLPELSWQLPSPSS